MILRLRVLFLFIYVITAPISAEKAAHLIIFTEELPPYNFIKNDTIQGINIDIIKRACVGADIACRFEIYPWNRAVKLATTIHNAGLVSTSRTAKREHIYQWVGPLVASTTCFYALADNEGVSINSTADLKNYTIGLQPGDVYEDLLRGYGLTAMDNYLYFSRKFEYVQAFKAKKLDLFLASINTLPSHLKHLNIGKDAIKPVFALTNPQLGGNYLALNKKVNQTVRDKLQAEVTKLMEPKQLLPIKSRYLGAERAALAYAENLNDKCVPN